MTGPAEPLVDVSDVRAHLNIPDADMTSDGELQGFVDAASAYIQRLTGPIALQTFTEIHSGGGPTICLRNPPVYSVTSVTEYTGGTGYTLTRVGLGDPTGTYSYSLDDPRTGILRRRYNGGFVGSFAGGHSNVQVVYVAGVAWLPEDIRMAVLEDIRGLWQPSQNGPSDSLFPAVGGSTTSTARANPVEMFPRVASVLAASALRAPSIA